MIETLLGYALLLAHAFLGLLVVFVVIIGPTLLILALVLKPRRRRPIFPRSRQ